MSPPTPAEPEDDSAAKPTLSWLRRILGGGVSRSAQPQMQCNESVAEALTEIVDELRATVARQELRLGEIEQGTLGQIEAVRNELRERIQHLLDEQRVCLRQISLRMGEEAALADRARRATDLRAEELAKKIAQP